MPTIKAFIRTSKKGNILCAVRFRLSDGRKIQLFGKSNLYVLSEQWDSKNEKIKAKVICDSIKRKEFDNAILEHKQYILEKYNELKTSPFNNWLDLVFNVKYNPEKYSKVKSETFFDFFAQFINESDTSDARKKHYWVVYRVLERFEKYTQEKLQINTFNEDTLKELEQFLTYEYKLIDLRPDIYSNIKRLPKERSKNTIIGMLDKLRTFFLWLKKDNIISETPFSNYSTGEATYGTPIYITKKERNHIMDFDFSKKPHLSIQRDIFIFQSLVGCRVSDLMRFTRDNINNGVLSYIAAKTTKKDAKTIEVPLSERAISILQKYKGYDGKYIFPFISQPKYNEAIREIFRIAGINRKVAWLNPKTRKEELKPIYEVASSHMARRTFIGNLYSKVKDPNLVGSLSGHVEGSKAFSRYRKIDIELKKEIVDNYLD